MASKSCKRQYEGSSGSSLPTLRKALPGVPETDIIHFEICCTCNGQGCGHEIMLSRERSEYKEAISFEPDSLSEICMKKITTRLTSCTTDHDQCNRDLSQGLELPTRLLQLEKHGSDFSVKLINTNGTRAKYTRYLLWALSARLRTPLPSLNSALKAR
jgi:hypothetical protein